MKHPQGNTVDMHSRLDRIVEEVRSDRSSGASELLISVLEELLSMLKQEDVGVSALEHFALRLQAAKPAMAPIFNLSNLILVSIEDLGSPAARLHGLVPAIESMLEEERTSPSRIAAFASKEIVATSLVTLSYSSAVIAVLSRLMEERDLALMVAESLPGGEGRRTAEIASSLGIETRVVPDSNLGVWVGEADAVVVGADAIGHCHVVNKVGTSLLALAAKEHGVKAYSVGSWSKLSPLAVTDFGFCEDGGRGGVIESTQVFEATPLTHFHRIITSRGVIGPAEVPAYISGIRTASLLVKQTAKR